MLDQASLDDRREQIAEAGDKYTRVLNEITEQQSIPTPPDVPNPPQRVALEAALTEVEQIIAFDQRPTPQTEPLPVRDVWTTPDEGGLVSAADIAALKTEYLKVPVDIRSGWLAALATEARQEHQPYNLGSDGAAHTVRRFEITRGLVALCLANDSNHEARSELLRAVLTAVIGDMATFRSIPAGRLLGSLNAAEAARFATLCDAWIADPQVDVEGSPSVTHLAALTAA
jgi:hypothetical protein